MKLSNKRKFSSLLTEKVDEFKHNMKELEYEACDQDLAHLCAKLGYEVKVGPIKHNGNDIFLGTYVHKFELEIAKTIRDENFSRNSKFHLFLKKQKPYNFHKMLLTLYRLGGKKAVTNFIIEEMVKFNMEK